MTFLVSVFMLTYNQEDFISETIESILMQQVDFNIQLVIGEDGSADKTRNICESYQRKFPEKIKILPSDKNIGLIQNFIRTLKECTGKYVAICDGDDYWTDPLKLQKQVDFLEKNLDYSIIFTSFKRLYKDGTFKIKDDSEIRVLSDFDDLILSNFIPSVTVLFKNKQHAGNFPSWLDRFPYGDWPIYLWTVRDGSKIRYLREETAVYRTEIGVSEKLRKINSDIVKVNLKILKCISEDPDFKHKNKIIRLSLDNHYFSLMASFFREGKMKRSFMLAKFLLKNHPVKVVRTYLYLIRRKFTKSNE